MATTSIDYGLLFVYQFTNALCSGVICRNSLLIALRLCGMTLSETCNYSNAQCISLCILSCN